MLQRTAYPVLAEEVRDVLIREGRGECPCFLDIETTGLSRKNSYIYLYGILKYEDGRWVLLQKMAESFQEEGELLQSLFSELSGVSLLITYNGEAFDLPFIRERCEILSLPFIRECFENSAPSNKEETGWTSLDLYRKYKPFAPLLSLPDRKMASLEKLLSLPEREFSSGKECISIYREYVKQYALRLALKEDWSAEKDSCSPALFGHNREDLLGLSGVTSLLSLFQLSEDRGDFLSASVTEAEKRQLCLVFSYALPFPALAFVRFPGGSFSLSGHEAAFCFDICEKGLPLYYTNYKEYDYIPTEDTAMPKSLSRFLDKSLRVSCKPENCRTWFPCSDDFLSSPEKIGEFLRHFFRYLFS